MKNKDLIKLKTQTLLFLDKWESKGGKTGGFFCPYCSEPNKTTIPEKKDVGSKGYWDSLTTCYNCGQLFMSIRKVGGEIIILKPEDCD